MFVCFKGVRGAGVKIAPPLPVTRGRQPKHTKTAASEKGTLPASSGTLVRLFYMNCALKNSGMRFEKGGGAFGHRNIRSIASYVINFFRWSILFMRNSSIIDHDKPDRTFYFVLLSKTLPSFGVFIASRLFLQNKQTIFIFIRHLFQNW